MASFDFNWYEDFKNHVNRTYGGDAILAHAIEVVRISLERNEELEETVKRHQTTVKEQTQKIKYIKKQSDALKHSNTMLLEIYEQAETNMKKMEETNHRLLIDNTNDKKLLLNQSVTIDNLEMKCEDLQKKVDELTEAHKKSTNSCKRNAQDWGEFELGRNVQSRSEKQILPSSPKFSQEVADNTAVTNDEMIELWQQLQEARNQRAREQKKVSELTQELDSLLQENTILEMQLIEFNNKTQDIKILQDNINTLEEIRQKQLCGRCLRDITIREHDELSTRDQVEYDYTHTELELIRKSQRDSEQSTNTSTVQDADSKTESTNGANNSYPIFVEKYQAFLETQRQSHHKDIAPANCMSLQQELEMSGALFFNFGTYTNMGEDEISSSSNFSERSKTQNKATQTGNLRRRLAPRYSRWLLNHIFMWCTEGIENRNRK